MTRTYISNLTAFMIAFVVTGTETFTETLRRLVIDWKFGGTGHSMLVSDFSVEQMQSVETAMFTWSVVAFVCLAMLLTCILHVIWQKTPD